MDYLQKAPGQFEGCLEWEFFQIAVVRSGPFRGDVIVSANDSHHGVRRLHQCKDRH
jgi:hypothetical protein